MLAHVVTATVLGVEPVLVRTEVNLSSGLPAFTVVGLPQSAVREGRERVAAALRNSGFELPQRRITVNLAPGDLRKGGTAFDLPIAVGLLVANGRIAPGALSGLAFLGELGLDGALRVVPGALPISSLMAREPGIRALVVPEGNAAEAALVRGVEVLGARTLADVAAHLAGRARLPVARVDPAALLREGRLGLPDLAEVRGQGVARRALEIAAAGAHDILLVGPPGSGKTMLASRLSGILPPLTVREALECTMVHSVAGLLGPDRPLVTARPFRAPHHSVSDAGLVGGGTPIRPGEISLAHHGVLFLDELPEFHRSALESLRQPLEGGWVQISRAHGTLRFPARFLLAAAMNPCPCGHRGDGSDRCLCDPGTVARYQGRVSGPLLDRIDLQVQVPAVSAGALRQGLAGEPSEHVSARVARTRELQTLRFAPTPGVHANGHMGPAEVRRWCRHGVAAGRLMTAAVSRLGLSARGYHRVLRVARTIADLAGKERIEAADVAEALQYRGLDRSEVRAAS